MPMPDWRGGVKAILVSLALIVLAAALCLGCYREPGSEVQAVDALALLGVCGVLVWIFCGTGRRRTGGKVYPPEPWPDPPDE
jgi:hypothetical protein